MRIFPTQLLGLLVPAFATTAAARQDLPPPQTVPYVDLERYAGTWYEIAAYPQRFQEGCTATSATYTLREDGELDVVNRCRQGAVDGPERSVEGRARAVDPSTNSKLEVNFFGPFWGDYWILDLGADYEYAVVGNPDRDALWILSRSPTMDPAVFEAIVARAEAQGYDRDRLVRTVQP